MLYWNSSSRFQYVSKMNVCVSRQRCASDVVDAAIGIRAASRDPPPLNECPARVDGRAGLSK